MLPRLALALACCCARAGAWVLYTNSAGTRSYNTTKCTRQARELVDRRGQTCATAGGGALPAKADTTEDRAQDCDGRCREDDACRYYSYRNSDKRCLRYSTCPGARPLPGNGNTLDVTTYEIREDANYARSARGGAEMTACILHRAVLQPFQNTIDFAVNHNSRDAYVCGHHKAMCEAIPENLATTPGCSKLYGNCQSALRHLHKMLFNQSPKTTAPQVCNNFARKSVRGFFHDFMSKHIDGSILSEHSIAINFGQYKQPNWHTAPSKTSLGHSPSVAALLVSLAFAATRQRAGRELTAR